MSREQEQEQPRAKVIEHPAYHPSEGFDRRVAISDAKTGRIIRMQPHNVHIISGQEYYERTDGTGNLFFRSGEVAGRWVKGEDGKFHVDPKAEHVTVTEPKEDADLTQAAVAEENEALKKELAALRAEKEASMKVEAPKAATAFVTGGAIAPKK